jgi:hypothetical protein
VAADRAFVKKAAHYTARQWKNPKENPVKTMYKLYPDHDNKATLACPSCERSRSIDATPYFSLSRVVRMRIKCPCGHQFAAELERRRHFRKPVHFKGTYIKAADRMEKGETAMAVLDLSRTGVRMRTHQSRTLRVGDRLLLQFQLDDAKGSTIRKESVVRRIDGADLGAEFTLSAAADPSAKAIGFYLFAA